MELIQYKSAAAFIVMAVLWGLEGWLPLFHEFNERGGRYPHAGRNLALGAFNAAVMGALFGGLVVFAAARARGAGFGLLPWLGLPGWAELLAAILIFDAWMYLWHRLNHMVPFFWRFHRVHHSDPRMDVTSGVRFHPGEIALSFLTRALAVPLLGMAIWQLAIYETILLPVILFHHSNLALPARADAVLRWIIVSPNMHRVHHSDFGPETDSNYASVFSGWDRIFGSFREREDYGAIRFGLAEYRDEEWHSLKGILKTPLGKGIHKTPPGKNEG
jgi:sterol desaturase/sphingolipid hydroxylase (fatty acid hydroxylase superfamily)